MARTSRVLDGVVVAVDFGVEKEDKPDDEDRDNGKVVGFHRNVSEKICGCTLARYLSCTLTLTQNWMHLTLATVAFFWILKMIVVVIWT